MERSFSKNPLLLDLASLEASESLWNSSTLRWHLTQRRTAELEAPPQPQDCLNMLYITPLQKDKIRGFVMWIPSSWIGRCIQSGWMWQPCSKTCLMKLSFHFHALSFRIDTNIWPKCLYDPHATALSLPISGYHLMYRIFNEPGFRSKVESSSLHLLFLRKNNLCWHYPVDFLINDIRDGSLKTILPSPK